MLSHADLLAGPNRGKAAAKLLLAKLFAASALAAYSGYASTRNVKTPEKIRIILKDSMSAISIDTEERTPTLCQRQHSPQWELPSARKHICCISQPAFCHSSLTGGASLLTYVVHANQNIPTVTNGAPAIAGGKRNSGSEAPGLPVSSSFWWSILR